MRKRVFALVIVFAVFSMVYAHAQVTYSKKSPTQLRIEDDVKETSLVVTRADLIALESTLSALLSQFKSAGANVTESEEQASGYAGAGNQGMTGSCASSTTLTVEDGLIISCS